MTDINKALKRIEKTEIDHLIKLADVKDFIRKQQSELRFYKPRFDAGQECYIIDDSVYPYEIRFLPVYQIHLSLLISSNEKLNNKKLSYEFYNPETSMWHLREEDEVFETEQEAKFKIAIKKWKHDNNIL